MSRTRLAIAALVIFGGGIAYGDYQATPGSGLTFGSLIVGGVHYATQAICDATAGKSQCAAVSAGGAVKVDGSGATQPISGNLTNISGTITLPTGAATAANQATEISSLASIVTNTAAAIPAGTAAIGSVLPTPLTYLTIAASQTAQVLIGGGSGATGDYLSHCVIYPTSTSPGVLTVFDNTSSATNNAIAFAGGATSTSNLTPITIPVGAKSINGAWKVTTGANMVATCVGKFT